MVSGQTLRSKRIGAEIQAEVVALRAGIDRARLSRIERGRITASPEELGRIDTAIESLICAKRQIEDCASRVGWPVAVIG